MEARGQKLYVDRIYATKMFCNFFVNDGAYIDIKIAGIGTTCKLRTNCLTKVFTKVLLCLEFKVRSQAESMKSRRLR